MDKANNATFYANRKELEELHEAYTTDIEGTLGIQAIEFKSMEEIEQREIMAKLAEAETYCENDKTKQKIHNKRVEFYDILCADTMYDAKDIDKMLQQQTSNQREKVKPIRLEPDVTRRVTYQPYDKYNIPRDPQFKKANEAVEIPILPTDNDDIYDDERLSQMSKRNNQIPKTTSPQKNPIIKALGNAYETGKSLIP